MGGTISLIRNGFDQSLNIPSPALTEKNIPDQSGKVFLITGANTGVGYEVSRILYSLNGTVYMGCRSESKAVQAITNIKTAHPSSTGKLVYLHLNLSDLTTIKSTADQFLSQESRLDWLNNNAGVMMPPPNSKSSQNHDLQLATNILGPFLLTKLLSPILKSTAAATSQSPNNEPSTVRVSWAGSFAVDISSPKGGIQFDSAGDIPPPANVHTAYGMSKVANWWLAYEFGRRYGTRDAVLHNAYNPGNLKSELQRHVESGPGGFIAAFLGRLLLYPAVMGAYTELYAGLSRDLSIEGGDQGGYVVPWGRRSGWNRGDVVAEMKEEGGGTEKLWEWCERMTKEFA